MARSVLVPAAVEYPSSDGTPVAESDFQLTPVAYARDALRDHFRGRPNVYVAANLFIYYEQDNLDAKVAPDVFVVRGAPNHDRHTYRLWQEPKPPDFVFEVTSRRTWREDQGRKRSLYRALGVAEYWQYDPTGDYLLPPLQGVRLVGGAYRRMTERASAAGRQEMFSSVLGLELRVSERGFRFHDPVAGEDLLSLTERGEALQRERQGREWERRERERAERGWQRAEQERQRAEQGRRRADQERQRERQARQEAEERIAALEAKLRDQGSTEPPTLS